MKCQGGGSTRLVVVYLSATLNVSRARLHNNNPNRKTHTHTHTHMQNPFYEMDMPIRCELFQLGVEVCV
jgi:hypothetical protein